MGSMELIFHKAAFVVNGALRSRPAITSSMSSMLASLAIPRFGFRAYKKSEPLITWMQNPRVSYLFVQPAIPKLHRY